MTMVAVQGMEQGPYRAVGEALEVIPRTLAQNCGANVIRTLTKLRAKHFDAANVTFGIDGNTGDSPPSGYNFAKFGSKSLSDWQHHLLLA